MDYKFKACLPSFLECGCQPQVLPTPAFQKLLLMTCQHINVSRLHPYRSMKKRGEEFVLSSRLESHHLLEDTLKRVMMIIGLLGIMLLLGSTNSSGKNH